VNAGDQFRMPIHWRERDWEHLKEAVRDEPSVRGPLAAYGLLKFFDCPLIRAQEYLLQYLISMWSTELQFFIVRGEQLKFSAMEDVYFLTGLPFRGRALPVDPSCQRMCAWQTWRRRYCSGLNFMSGSVAQIEAMDALVHLCIATMIMRIYGSLVTQRINGGMLRIMQRALGGEFFSWGLMLHTKMMGQLNRCWVVDSSEFTFGSSLVAWFLERVPMLRPRVLLPVADAREP
jgi:hypothetical protein